MGIDRWTKKDYLFSSLVETLTSLGKYTLKLNTTRDACATFYGGRQLPSYVLKFSIKGKVCAFTILSLMFNILSEYLRYLCCFDSC